MKALRFSVPQEIRDSKGLPCEVSDLVHRARNSVPGGCHGPLERVEFERKPSGAVVAHATFRDGAALPSWAHGRRTVELKATEIRLHNLLVEEVEGESARRAAFRASQASQGVVTHG